MLHGLPVSLKECCGVAGHDATIGSAKRIDLPMPVDAVIVQVLRAQGAIPGFCRTNLPQTMLSFECSNPVYGQTANPHDTTRGPGGSSGGEGCLIASGGSLLGIGTDIGGSCRIPAHFSGCCGFKPTAGRISGKGFATGVAGQEAIKGTPGPMAAEVDGLALLMAAMLADGRMHALDPTVPPIPFNMDAYAHPLPGATESKSKKAKPMRIGYFEYDGFAQATPACVRAVREARALLAAKGHTLVNFEPTMVAEKLGVDTMALFAHLLGADQAATIKAGLADEPVDPVLSDLVFKLGIPSVLRKVVSALYVLKGQPRIADLVSKGGRRTVQELWRMHARRKEVVTRMLEACRDMQLDALLCPASVMPAAKAGDAAQLGAMCNYTALFNVFDMPAGVLPVTRVTAADEAALTATDVRGFDDWQSLVWKTSAGAVGLPVAVQLASMPWEDEVCLRAMKELESEVGEELRAEIAQSTRANAVVDWTATAGRKFD